MISEVSATDTTARSTIRSVCLGQNLRCQTTLAGRAGEPLDTVCMALFESEVTVSNTTDPNLTSPSGTPLYAARYGL